MSAEQSLIESLRGWAPNRPDDWRDDAYWEPAPRRVYSVDAFVEGVHFRRDWTPNWGRIGHKCAAAAWSDVAAMGAKPLFWLVSLGLPVALAHDLPAVTALYQGMRGVLAQTGHPQAALIGGDTVQAPQLTLSITVIGEVPPDAQVGLRAGARPGDIVVTTGWPGLSALGLHALAHGVAKDWPTAVAAHELPLPQFSAGSDLAGLNSRYALMDTSDGLADAALQIAAASGVGLVLASNRLPLHPHLLAAQEGLGLDALALALYGGEDFQLLACLPPETFRRLTSQQQERFAIVGRVEAGLPGSAWLESSPGERTPLSAEQTFQHFPPGAGEVDA